MEKYYLLWGKKLVKGVSKREKFFLVNEAFEFEQGEWKQINVNIINDRLMGFDGDGIGSTSSMDAIEEISVDEAKRYMSE